MKSLEIVLIAVQFNVMETGGWEWSRFSKDLIVGLKNLDIPGS